jgi:hypothetical protein
MSQHIQSLIDTFSNPSRKTPIKDEAVLSLQKLGPPAVSLLAKALKTTIHQADTDEEQDKKNREETRQMYAARTLGRMGKEAAEAVPQLADLFATSSRAFIKIEVAIALSKIGIVEDQTINMDIVYLMLNTLNASKDNWHEDLREAAAKTLGEFGPLAKNAVPYLIMCLMDRNDKVRQAASTSLQKIGRVALPTLLETLKNREKIRTGVLLPDARVFDSWIRSFNPEHFDDLYSFERARVASNSYWFERELIENYVLVEKIFEESLLLLVRLVENEAELRIILLELAQADANQKLQAIAKEALARPSSQVSRPRIEAV